MFEDIQSISIFEFLSSTINFNDNIFFRWHDEGLEFLASNINYLIIRVNTCTHIIDFDNWYPNYMKISK